MGSVKWMGAALVGIAGVALVVAWALAPNDDFGDASRNDSNADVPSTAKPARVRDHTAPAPVVDDADLARDALAEDASAPTAPDDDAIVVDGLDPAVIGRSIALFEAIDVGGVTGANAWRELIELLKDYDGDRRVFVELVSELERTDQTKLAGLLLAALGNVVDDALTLRVLESVDRLHEPILRRTAILCLAADRRELGPPPGDRLSTIDGIDWVGLAGGVHETPVRRLLIARFREWSASDAAEDGPLAEAATQVLRYSVTYPDARNALIEAIDAPREEVGTAAVMALTRHSPGPEVRDALVYVVTTESAIADHARFLAGGALVRLGGSDGVELVVTALETAEHPSTHYVSALCSLSSYRTSPELIGRARDVLLHCLDARDPEAQEYAAIALIWKTDPRDALAADADEILARVVAYIRDPTRDATARWRVLQQMSTRTATLELGFDAFVEVARDESATLQLREAALEMLGKLASAESSSSSAAEEVLRGFPETTEVERLRSCARRELGQVVRERK